MPQEFQVLQCYKCETFQVHQVKKALKWICKLCGEKQSIKKVYGRGSGVDCRKHVQQLNTRRGELSTLRGVSLPTVDSYHDNCYHDNSEDLPDNERYTRPGTSKWSQYSEIREELGTSLSDGEDDPQVTTDRNYFKNQNKAVKRKAKETTKHPSKYPKWEAISCLDQTDTSQSGQFMFGLSVKRETGNYSQHSRKPQPPESIEAEVIGCFNTNDQFKNQENKKQSRNNNITSHKTLDQYGVGTPSKWGRYIQNKMNYVQEEENEKNAGVYVPEEDYMGKDQGKTHKTDYDTKMNDETTHTSNKHSSSMWRRCAEKETDSLTQEETDTTEIEKSFNNENIRTDSGVNFYDKRLKTLYDQSRNSSNSWQEQSEQCLTTDGDRTRNIRNLAMNESQKPSICDSVNKYVAAGNGSQKENLEQFKNETLKNICHSGSKWSRFMPEGHSQLVADDDNSDDNFVNEDMKDVIRQTDDSGDVIGQAYDSEVVTGQAYDSEFVVGQACDSGGITGQACDSEVVTGQANDSEVVTGQTYDSEVVTGQACDSEVITGQAHVSVTRNMGLSCKDFTHKDKSKNNIHVVDKIQGPDKTVSDDKNRIAASKSMPLKQLNIDGCSGPVHLDRGYVVKHIKTAQKSVKENLSIFSAGELADEDLEF